MMGEMSLPNGLQKLFWKLLTTSAQQVMKLKKLKVIGDMMEFFTEILLCESSLRCLTLQKTAIGCDYSKVVGKHALNN
jgi:hypothetical protein